MGFLAGKRALVVGVASNKSIAWGIAQAMRREGAEIALTYQNERLRERVERFAADLDSDITLPCDVAEDEQIDACFTALASRWPSFDILVHSIAFANREELQGDYVDNVSRDGFRVAHEVSSYSFTALAKRARGMMNRGGALLTMTYIGAVRAMPSYNVMGLAKASLEANIRYMARSLGPDGLRVNGISAGPIRTLAASGVKDLRRFLEYVERTAPIGRNITIEDVGNAAAFLGSELASGITGEILYVDGGFNTVGIAEV